MVKPKTEAIIKQKDQLSTRVLVTLTGKNIILENAVEVIIHGLHYKKLKLED